MIHQYKLNGYNIVLDTCSGSVHAVDEVAYDMIGMYEENDKETIIKAMLEKYGDMDDVNEEELNLCYEDIEELKAAGKLFTPNTYESMAGTFKERSGDVVKALVVSPLLFLAFIHTHIPHPLVRQL